MSQLLGGRERTAGLRFLIQVHCCLSELNWETSPTQSKHRQQWTCEAVSLKVCFIAHLFPPPVSLGDLRSLLLKVWSVDREHRHIVKLVGDAEPEPNAESESAFYQHTPVMPMDNIEGHWFRPAPNDLFNGRKKGGLRRKNVTEVLDSVRTKATCYGCIRTYKDPQGS